MIAALTAVLVVLTLVLVVATITLTPILKAIVSLITLAISIRMLEPEYQHDEMKIKITQLLRAILADADIEWHSKNPGANIARNSLDYRELEKLKNLLHSLGTDK